MAIHQIAFEMGQLFLLLSSVWGSPKSLGFINWRPLVSVQNFMAMYPRVSEIFQSGSKWWPDRHCHPQSFLAEIQNLLCRSTYLSFICLFCWYYRCHLKLHISLCCSLQSVGTLKHQQDDHTEHRHCVWADPDAPGAGQRQHGGEYGLPEPGSGAHPQRVWPHLWNEKPFLIFSDRVGGWGWCLGFKRLLQIRRKHK